MAQSISQEAIGATGLPGATAASRHAGATTSGAPTTGTFAVGDFVVDQTGAMYVCTVAGTPGTWQLSGVSVNENIAGKNFVINGGMDIWQRGTSFALTTTTPYTADRWCIQPGANSVWTASQVVSGLTGFKYAQRFQRTSGSTSTANLNIGNSIETLNSLPLAGQTVILSFWARAGANLINTPGSIISYGTGTDQNLVTTAFTAVSSSYSNTYTSSWVRYQQAATIPSNATQVGVQFYLNGESGTAGANDYFDITGVQLEIAPQATPFSRAGGSIGGELALCQRYYWQITSTAIYNRFAFGFSYSTTGASILINSPVSMRATPSASYGNTLALYNTYFYNLTSITAPSAIMSNVINFNVSVASGLTAYTYYQVIDNSGSAYLALSSEL